VTGLERGTRWSSWNNRTREWKRLWSSQCLLLLYWTRCVATGFIDVMCI